MTLLLYSLQRSYYLIDDTSTSWHNAVAKIDIATLK